MMLKRTKLMLASAAFAVALPTTMVLSQDRQDPTQGQADRQQQQQQDRQTDRIGGMAGQQQGDQRQMTQKWFEHVASANQFEIEAARLVSERLGGQQPGQQPGMGQDRPGAGQPDTDRPGQTGDRPGGGTGGMTGQGAGGQTGGLGDRSGQQDRPGDRLGQQDRPGQDAQQARTGMGGGFEQHRQQIQQIAQSVERDHQQALQTLRQHAQQAGVQISETPELNPVHRAKLDELRQKHGEEFARAWVFGQMAGHTYAILEHTWASQHAPDQHVKQYAQGQLDSLQRHAQQIAPIAYELAGVQEARTAGERMGEQERPMGDRPMGQPGQQGQQQIQQRIEQALIRAGAEREEAQQEAQRLAQQFSQQRSELQQLEQQIQQALTRAGADQQEAQQEARQLAQEIQRMQQGAQPGGGSDRPGGGN